MDKSSVSASLRKLSSREAPYKVPGSHQSFPDPCYGKWPDGVGKSSKTGRSYLPGMQSWPMTGFPHVATQAIPALRADGRAATSSNWSLCGSPEVDGNQSLSASPTAARLITLRAHRAPLSGHEFRQTQPCRRPWLTIHVFSRSAPDGH